MTIVAASGMHDLGSAVASAFGSAGSSAVAAVMGNEEGGEEEVRKGESFIDIPFGEWVNNRPDSSRHVRPCAAQRHFLLRPVQPHGEGRDCDGSEQPRPQASCCSSCMPFFSRSRRPPPPAEAAVPTPQPAALEQTMPRVLNEAEERSRSRLEEHVRKSLWHPTVLLYDASPDPPPLHSAERKPRRAHHLPLNSRRPCQINNEHFVGSFLFLHRLPDSGSENLQDVESPYEWHFEKKTRRWEARVQGRFRQIPTGRLWTGCVLEDFDYSTEQSWAASTLATAVVPLMEAVVGERFYFSWGTRGEAADEPDAELATIVTNLAGTDQVIHTPSSEPVPGIDSDISKLGLRRNAMSASDYRQAVQGVVDSINTTDTYTFCVWGCSRYIDVMSSSFTTPALGSWSYAGFLDEWPAHFILYGLDDSESDPRHLERKKKYYVDVMVWSSDMDLPKLPQRYCFEDERQLLVERPASVIQTQARSS